ncbi:uncharacterized protein PADG_03230 [Paracoccidioides brasiliensis Pb18]|uniref:MOSC domain-containing protein n=1 Tax=Paracoccidioides brasiliensis (strain Pb18) TaxID=502780 RepID=C1G7S5_PARBD|nr:uncharacterized protein PADG_03230 [Paracoccidioides brasiliensis Pb18]EEH47132.1 hypothetical protein PADG_03230 [Paracoccidioides brasiliensis Pb18]
MFTQRLDSIFLRLHLSVTTTFLALIYILCLSPIFLLLSWELLSRRAAAREPKGCRKLGLHNFSNLNDEGNYDTNGRRKRRQNQKNDAGKGQIRIKALLAYPIKSCAGVEFSIAQFVSTGMAYDRQFCFAEYMETPPAAAVAKQQQQQDKPTGQWICRTMRDGKYSRMALIRPEIWVPDPSSRSYSVNHPDVLSKGVLVINYPRTPSGTGLSSLLISIGMKLGLCSREESFHVPLHPPPSNSKTSTYPYRPVRIWKDNPMAVDYGKHIPPSLITFLEPSRPLTLFRVDPEHRRNVFRCAPRKEALGFQPTTGFADAYPLHMLGLASVREVAERTSHAIPKFSVRRFRPNIVIEGSKAFEEDSWKLVRFVSGRGNGKSQLLNEQLETQHRGNQDGIMSEIPDDKQPHSRKGGDGGIEVYTSCRTVRCRLPNVDPNTGLRHRAEPDKTLKSFRCIDPGDANNACLGMQCVPAVQEFTLRVGDELEVLETGEHFYIKQ